METERDVRRGGVIAGNTSAALAAAVMSMLAILAIPAALAEDGAAAGEQEIYIYARHKLPRCHRGCGNIPLVVQMESMLHLNGSNEWAYNDRQGTDRSYCRIDPPRSSEIHRRISPLLGVGSRGHFDPEFIRTLIINKATGERVFVDWQGGYYVFGRGVTMQMPPGQEYEYYRILDKAIDEGYCHQSAK